MDELICIIPDASNDDVRIYHEYSTSDDSDSSDSDDCDSYPYWSSSDDSDSSDEYSTSDDSDDIPSDPYWSTSDDSDSSDEYSSSDESDSDDSDSGSDPYWSSSDDSDSSDSDEIDYDPYYYGDNSDTSDSDDSDSDDEEKGLSPARIQKFHHFQADQSLVGDRCGVCLDDIEVGRRMIRLDCPHSFCQVCVEGWLAGHKTCPNCRHQFK